MSRLRQRPDERMPEHLRAFRLADWPVGEDAGLRNGCDREIAAIDLYTAAKRQWLQEHGAWPLLDWFAEKARLKRGARERHWREHGIEPEASKTGIAAVNGHRATHHQNGRNP